MLFSQCGWHALELLTVILLAMVLLAVLLVFAFGVMKLNRA